MRRDSGAAPLLERGAEQHALATAIAGAARGQGRLLLVEGPEGLGKTRLLRAARAYAVRAGAAAGLVHAARAEGELEHGVALRLVQALLAGADSERSGALGAGLLDPTAVAGADRDAAATADGLLRAVARLAQRRTLLLAVDDAQWADEASLAFLDVLAHRVATLPVVLVIARRPEEPTPGQDALDELTRRADAVVLRLAPISPAGAEVLVDRVLGRGAPRLAAAAHAATSGIPLVLGELLEAVRTDARPAEELADRLEEVVPSTLQRWSLRRLADLPEEARGVAEAAALLDEPPGLDVVARILGTTLPATQDAAAMLSRRGVLRSADPVALDPPLLTWALRSGLAPERRRALHSAATRVLTEEDRVREAAEHLLAVPPAGSPWVVERLRAGAAAAGATGDHEGAVRLLRRALDEPPPPADQAAINFQLGAALVLLRPREALSRLEEASFEALDPDLAARATLLLADVQRLTGHTSEAILRLRTLAETHAEALADHRRQAQAGLSDALDEPPRDDAGRSSAAATTRGHRLIALRGAAHGIAEAHDAGTVAAQVERALDRGVLADEPLAADLRLVQGLSLLTACGRPELTLVHVEHVLSDPRSRGAELLRATLRLARAGALLHRDRVREAQLDADEALRYVAVHAPALAGLAAELAVRARLAQGLRDEAREVLSRVGAVGGELPVARGRWRLARARIALAEGDLRHGVEAMLEARGALDGTARNESALPVVPDVVDALVELGDLERARELADETLARQRAFGEPRGLGLALRAAAAVANDRGDQEALLARSAARLADANSPLERATVLIRLAELCELDGDRPTVRRLLREAADQAGPRGAAPLHAQASSLLTAAGGRARPAAADAVGALSTAQRKVADLAAAGSSNREIADELVLSVKTVEMHLSRAYKKLGISSRAQLAEVLAERREIS